ncbi:MAG: WD40 repeat domain-containing protein [Alphaproteobacteria bacterium]|nr:WD40 repeat domain-containing protein [Alphaproteobacteria bacterium]
MTDAIHRRWKFDAPALSLCVNHNGDFVLAALADGTAKLFPANDSATEPKTIALHDGISLSLKPDADGQGFLSGGDDGKVVIVEPAVDAPTLLAAHKNQWIDHVASSSDGKYRAYNVGKKIYVLDEEGKPKFAEPLTVPSNVGDLCFSPNGKRLAASHYNGVTLWWMNSKHAEPATLTWKGSHLDLVWSPDGKNILTSLQENALHGWQLADSKEMRMQGYAAKVRSMGFTVRGKYLATSGAEQIICWPFSGGGPWGKPPLTLGGQDARMVSFVAPHPKDEMVAAGYGDGMIVLAPIDGRMEVMIAPPVSGEKQAITGLVWNAAGDALFAATESGAVMLFTLDSVRRAVTGGN